MMDVPEDESSHKIMHSTQVEPREKMLEHVRTYSHACHRDMAHSRVCSHLLTQ
jgi:hypothetical protein